MLHTGDLNICLCLSLFLFSARNFCCLCSPFMLYSVLLGGRSASLSSAHPFFLNGKCIPIVYSSSCSSFLITFFWPFGGFIDRTAQDMIGNRMRERGRDTRQRASRQGLEPGAAAARTKPLHMERLLQQPSWTAPQEQISWVSITEGNHICWLAAIEFRQLSKPCLCLKFDYTKISHKMTCNAW